jgi:hypothetical protein
LEVTADQQFLNQQPGHDGLASAGVVGKQESERLARQHLAVNGCDLVRERIYKGGVDGKKRVKQVGEIDPLRFGDKPEELAISVEAPGTAGFSDLQRGFAVAIDQF